MQQLDLPIGGGSSEIAAPPPLPDQARLEVTKLMAQLLLELVQPSHGAQESEVGDE
jgi:hypothetical protein